MANEENGSWRVIRRGRFWHVQHYVSNEHGKGWWNIGHPRENEDDAIAIMNQRVGN